MTETLTRERDLYRRMLELGATPDVDSFLREALELVVGAAQAARGYLALYTADAKRGAPPRYRLFKGFEATRLEEVEGCVSRGIVEASRSERRVLNIPNALLSDEFGSNQSIVRQRVEAVLCAPIGEGGSGVLYLEGAQAGGQVFGKPEEEMVALVARHLGPIAERLLLKLRLEQQDPTERFRSGGRFTTFAGRSLQLARVLEKATIYATGSSPILLTGPTGTGKSELAREIHALSRRSAGPFVTFDLGVQNPSLLEQHLFGAEPGAFTDRREPLAGAVSDARGGTLFLDEIGDLPLAVQARLLRLIEEGRYTRLGSTRELTADVRIVAATNRDPAEEARKGTFRQDLFHRLNAFPIALPAVDDRRQDVPLLLESVGERVAARLGVPWPGVTEGARLAAEARSWPGNVREIRNHLERALLRTQGMLPIDARALFEDLDATADDPDDGLPSWERANRSFQRAFLVRALEANGWNNRATFESIRLSRSRYFELLKELDIRAPGADAS